MKIWLCRTTHCEGHPVQRAALRPGAGQILGSTKSEACKYVKYSGLRTRSRAAVKSARLAYLEYEQLFDQYDSRVGAAHSEVLGFPSRLPGPRVIQESTLEAVVDVIDRGPGHAVAVVQPPGTGKTW